MCTATKVWLIVAGALIALGIIVFGTAFMAIPIAWYAMAICM